MDRYTKLVLTIIAVGLIGVNIQLFKNEIVTEANAGIPPILELMNSYDFQFEVRRIVVLTCQADLDDGDIMCDPPL